MDITERQVVQNTQDMQMLLANQERFQAMLNQVMQHVMHMASNQFRAAPGEMDTMDAPMGQGQELIPEQEYQIRLAAAEDLQVENYMRQHGVRPGRTTGGGRSRAEPLQTPPRAETWTFSADCTSLGAA